MQSITLHTRVGEDGILKLEMPGDVRNTELEIVVVFTPAGKESAGWPAGFFEKTFGCIPDFPDRAPQGEYETRNALE
jgi:hypothetical protein